ncbi:MAG TPA: hypothetical protein DCL74_00815 [Succinivibrionaceae bacterium]|mgnify:CR=1 FL=1|nr:hypothetical protein [Succinivibrionaceae bacterium]
MKKKIISFIEKLNPIKAKDHALNEGDEVDTKLQKQAVSNKKIGKDSKKSKILSFDPSPKGDPAKNFKKALFNVCVRYHPDFGSIAGLGLVSGLLGKEGYADTAKIDKKLYTDTLKELTDGGMLQALPGYEIYAHPAQISEGSGKVLAREESDILSEDRSRRYVNRVCDQNGNELRVKSSIVILPGDEIAFDAVGDVAYVKQLVKKRVCVLTSCFT